MKFIGNMAPCVYLGKLNVDFSKSCDSKFILAL